MEVLKVKDYEEISIKAASIVVDEIKKKPDLNICYAVGNSSIGMFNELIKQYNNQNVNFKRTKAFLLDEYCNNTYHLESGARYFLKTYFISSFPAHNLALLLMMLLFPKRFLSQSECR